VKLEYTRSLTGNAILVGPNGAVALAAKGEGNDQLLEQVAHRFNTQPALVEALTKLEQAASELSGHKGTSRKGPRTAGDWSRLHTRIAESRAALSAAEAEQGGGADG
jgi:hypothetical protein